MPTTESPAGLSVWRRRAMWVAVGYGAIILAAWLFLRLGADEWWPATVLLFGPRWVVALPLIVLVPAAVVVRAWRALAVLGAAGLVVAGPVTGGTVSPGTWWAEEGPVLRVATCNVQVSALNKVAFAAWLRDTGPDVVLMQESIGVRAQDLVPADWHVSVGQAGLQVASRFPVKSAEYLTEKELGGQGVVGRYLLETPLGELTVVNVHLPTPRDGFELLRHRDSHGVGVVREQIAMRDRASAAVRAWLGEVGPAAIVAGDFNTPVESAIYRRHWSDLGNAFSEAGWGWGFTKETRWFGVRIDHVLYGKAWECRRARVGPDVGSDHRPVIVDLVPREP